jgi:RimJ/RimL family protein N-acetyltransferase
MKPDWPLETERLLLRPFEEGDLDAFFAIQSDEESARWLYNEPRTLDETKALLQKKIAGDRLTAEGDWLAAAVVARETEELVGDLSMQWVSEQHKTGEIGFIFGREHHGRGYATEAAGAFLGFGFEGMGFHRMVGRLEPRNTASARVLEKLGMRREALLVENEWVKGEWSSELVYAILDREWQ